MVATGRYVGKELTATRPGCEEAGVRGKYSMPCQLCCCPGTLSAAVTAGSCPVLMTVYSFKVAQPLSVSLNSSAKNKEDTIML